MRALLAVVLAAGTAQAEGVRFAPQPDALPVEHVYFGGWEHFVGGGVAVLDCNGDALPDLFVAGGDGPARLFVNTSAAGTLSFRAAPLPEITGVTGAYPLDLDGDGRLDLAVLRVGPNVMLRGMGECAFAPADMGIDPGTGWTTAFSATWEAGATRPTLAFGNYVDRADPDGPFGACDTNVLMRPRAGGYEALDLPGHCALSLLFSDWAGRGRADLRVSNDRHYYLRGGAEQMWRLTDPPTLLGPDDGFDPISIWGMGIASRDITGDRVPEIMLTSMGDQVLLLSRPGGHDIAPFERGATAHRPHVGDDGRPSTGWHATFGDVDNDGRDDLFIAKGNVDQMPGNAMADPNSLLMQSADGRFAEVAGPAGIASPHRGRGAALTDLDGDGRLDLVVVNRRAPVEIWRNEIEGATHWVAIAPRQPGPNPNAIGARIEVDGPLGRHVREITVGGGHAGGVSGPEHFGLGAPGNVRVRVIWPDGVVGDWQAVEPGGAREILR